MDIAQSAGLDLPLVYQADEVIAGQRLRFRHSSRLNLIAGFGALAVTYFIARQLSPYVPHPGGRPDWGEPLAVAAVFVVIPALVYLLAPILDFRLRRDWRASYILHLNQDRLRISRVDASSTAAADLTTRLELPWTRLSRVLEAPPVFLLFFGSERSFVIVPHRIFTTSQQLDYFRSLLK